MVRAILDGSKRMTRRMMKPQPVIELANLAACPYGQPGDRLWVRESWRIGAWDESDGTIAIDYCDGPRREWLSILNDDDGEKFNHYWISCCDELARKRIEPGTDGRYHWEPGQSPLRWRPSIHMPRWASRITLEVVSVRVERLGDISEQDAIAEGVEGHHIEDGMYWRNYMLTDEEAEVSPMLTSAKASFRSLWESINGEGSWSINPWVWAVSFRRVGVKNGRS